MKTIYALVGLTMLVGCATPPNEGQPQTMAAPQSEVCKRVSRQEIAALFDRWNQSLLSGDPKKVVANYASNSILLPTVSNKPRLTPEEKEDYFHHFLEKKPSGKIDMNFIDISCNTALDAGLYTFTFAKTGEKVSGRYSFTYRWDGKEWLVTSHHSSVMPEKKPQLGKRH